MSCTSMNEVKDAMMSAYDRSFFLYSNGIVSPMKAMFVHEIDISGFVRWTSGWIVGISELASMYIATQCCHIRCAGSEFPTRAEGTFNSLGNLFLA